MFPKQCKVLGYGDDRQPCSAKDDGQSKEHTKKMWDRCSTRDKYRILGQQRRRPLRPIRNMSHTFGQLSREVALDPGWSQTAESESWFYHFMRACATKRNNNKACPMGRSRKVLEQCLAEVSWPCMLTTTVQLECEIHEGRGFILFTALSLCLTHTRCSINIC